MAENTFYLTTPIYYPSGKLHIGNAYTTVAADTLARYHRLRGKDVMFLTGTDEHGQKIEESAKSTGLPPQEYVDLMYEGIVKLWKRLNISYDRFIRTTDKAHEAAVQTIFTKLMESGDIYKGEYEGWYCTSDEAFWTKTQLEEGRCPECGGPVSLTKEESYFFRLSTYADRLTALLESGFVVPKSRAREMINNFIKPGLEDLAMTRSSFSWGVPVPGDPKHVIYVWVDALSNYITALGYPDTAGDYARYWPADLQLIGKDIVRFHVIIWPAILLALGLELPKQIYAHGWLLFDNEKMSKSKGNVVDPEILCDLYGVDAVRYFLLRELPFGGDGNFTNEALIRRINSDLANDLGNLVSRTASMIGKYFPAGLPWIREAGDFDDELLDMAGALRGKVEARLDAVEIAGALSDIFAVVSRANKYIDETTPWILSRSEENMPRLAAVLYNLGDVLRVIAVLLAPFLTETPAKIRSALGIPEVDERDGLSLSSWESAGELGRFVSHSIEKTPPLFPRLDLEESLEELELARLKAGMSAADAVGVVSAEKEGSQATVSEDKQAVEEQPEEELITYDEFMKMKLQIGTVKSAEKVKKTDKLLRLIVDFGKEERQIVSGIAEAYAPEDVVRKQYVFVTNLAPRKIRGIESQGMILTAEHDGRGMTILTVNDEVAPGAPIR